MAETLYCRIKNYIPQEVWVGTVDEDCDNLGLKYSKEQQLYQGQATIDKLSLEEIQLIPLKTIRTRVSELEMGNISTRSDE